MTMTTQTGCTPQPFFRRLVIWILLAIVCIPTVFAGAGLVAVYNRRNELLGRQVHGRGCGTFSPFVRRECQFKSRPTLPTQAYKWLGQRWLEPLDPFTSALLVAESDDDVRKLSQELELTIVRIAPKEGNCSEKLLQYLVHLPRMQELTICDVPLTGDGVAFISKMSAVKELCLECSERPSPGLLELSSLTGIETLVLIDVRSPITVGVCEQIARMPNLRELRLCSLPSTDGFEALAQSTTIERISFTYVREMLTMERGARQMACMTALKQVAHSGPIEPQSLELLSAAGLIEPEIELLALPAL